MVWWALAFALVTLVFTVIAELGQSREFEPSGKNPIASILAGGVFFLASILGEGVIVGIRAFLFCLRDPLRSAFSQFGGIFLLGKVSGFFGSWLPNVLHFVLFASGKYLVALPIIDWAIQKSRVVQKCIYLPMVFISAGLNGICFLYYSVLDDILAGLNLMGANFRRYAGIVRIPDVSSDFPGDLLHDGVVGKHRQKAACGLGMGAGGICQQE